MNKTRIADTKNKRTVVITWKQQPALRSRIKAASDLLMKRNAEAYKILADR